jgi:ABC-2 type transport system ATP-binding protein
MGRGGGPAGRSLLARHGPAPGHRNRLLGDPATVILDAPLNGLDPEGIGWVRSLLGDLAADGRTVFVSSHLLNELALTARHLIVIGRGGLLADTGVADFVARAGAAGPGPQHRPGGAGRPAPLPVGGRLPGPRRALTVSGLSTDQVGRIAGAAGITLPAPSEPTNDHPDPASRATGSSMR